MNKPKQGDLFGGPIDYSKPPDITDSDLTTIRDDFWAVLCSSPAEVQGLRDAIAAGKIDGGSYTGECACLVGTLANTRHCKYTEIPGLAPSSSRPAERLFFAIRNGDTPGSSQFSRLALGWVDEWLFNMRAAFSINSAASAAAPSLLAACEEALTVLQCAISAGCDDPDTERHSMENHGTLKALRAAISAAKGG